MLGGNVFGWTDTLAAETGASPVQVALAWLMAQPGISAPIASATSPAQLTELMAAMELTLDARQLALLDGAIDIPI